MPDFETSLIPTVHWTAISPSEFIAPGLLIFFIFLSIMEAVKPHVEVPRAVKNLSLRTNAGLFLANSILLSTFSVSSLLLLAEHYSGKGLLHHISNPFLQIIIAFIALDLLLYAWHLACHRFDSLWMFHRVHHSDNQMSTTTAFRVHIVELLMTYMLKATYIIVLGVDKMLLITEEAIMTFFVMFHHANLSFAGERWLKHVFVVPSLHRAHHSIHRYEHDNNYGAALSIWDRMFGTLIELEPEAVGIKNNPALDLYHQILLGFSPVHAGLPTSGEIIEAPFNPINLKAMIAESAYYKAEKRGFVPGFEVTDWLESEKEICRSLISIAGSGYQEKINKRADLPDFEPFPLPAAA